MNDTATSFATVAALSDYVRDTLCQFDVLDPNQITFVKQPLTRGGKPWGMVFHVEGPRLLRTSAIWAADAGTIVFYDSTGMKRQELKLVESPELVEKDRPLSKRAA